MPVSKGLIILCKQKCTASVLFFLCALIFMLGWPVTVDAEIYVHRTIPSPEAVLEQSPERIQVEFTRSIKANVSQLWLEDDRGQRIDGLVVAEDKKLVLHAPRLAEGMYEVHWRVMGLDAFVADGSFRFQVGEDNASSGSGVNPVSTEDFFSNASESPERDNRILWVHLAELFLLLSIAGWVLFRLFLWSAEGDRLFGVNQETLYDWERKIFIFAAVVLLVTGVGQIFHRAFLVSGASWQTLLFWQTVVKIFTSTFFGLAVISRGLLLIGLAWLSAQGKHRKRLKLILSIALMFTFVLTSHAYYSQMLISHFVHLFVVAFWLSGLLGFTVYSFHMKRDWSSITYMHQRLHYFSILSVFLLAIAVISGILMSVVYVETWLNLTHTDYGRTMLWKVALFIPILLIAAWHRWVWWPALKEARTKREGAQRLRVLLWGLRLELVIAIGMIVLTGVLSQTSPPGYNVAHDHAEDIAIYLERVQSDEKGNTILLANVLQDQKRLQHADVTFEVWDKEREELFIDIQNYCQSNNMRMELFKDALVERGFIRETVGEETNSSLYVGRFALEPGVWNIGVRVENEDEEDVYAYENFTVEVE